MALMLNLSATALWAVLATSSDRKSRFDPDSKSTKHLSKTFNPLSPSFHFGPSLFSPFLVRWGRIRLHISPRLRSSRGHCSLGDGLHGSHILGLDGLGRDAVVAERFEAGPVVVLVVPGEFQNQRWDLNIYKS